MPLLFRHSICSSKMLLITNTIDRILIIHNSSHANVHSSNRPHYCPVKGCPRGDGGKGFKRKNEMIRHGLVHDSPGYICPFCPLREHRYPRPDNLQRYVCMTNRAEYTPLTFDKQGMFEFITSTKRKTTLFYVKFWLNDLKVAIEDVGAVQGLDLPPPPTILPPKRTLPAKSLAFDRPWLYRAWQRVHDTFDTTFVLTIAFARLLCIED